MKMYLAEICYKGDVIKQPFTSVRQAKEYISSFPCLDFWKIIEFDEVRVCDSSRFTSLDKKLFVLQFSGSTDFVRIIGYDDFIKFLQSLDYNDVSRFTIKCV